MECQCINKNFKWEFDEVISICQHITAGGSSEGVKLEKGNKKGRHTRGGR